MSILAQEKILARVKGAGLLVVGCFASVAKSRA